MSVNTWIIEIGSSRGKLWYYNESAKWNFERNGLHCTVQYVIIVTILTEKSKWQQLQIMVDYFLLQGVIWKKFWLLVQHTEMRDLWQHWHKRIILDWSVCEKHYGFWKILHRWLCSQTDYLIKTSRCSVSFAYNKHLIMPGPSVVNSAGNMNTELWQ